MHERFIHWSAAHYFILLLTVLVPALLIWFARKRGTTKLPQRIAVAAGSLLLLNYVAYVIYRVSGGYWQARYDLPMELCNWATFATGFALITRNRFLAELAFFWVMAGSINGVISPDLSVSFPHIYFFIFFIAHGGLVCGALYLVFGLQLYPRPGALWRVFLFSQVYLASAFAINSLLGGNYGYTMAKPASASLIDHLGPWPWYLLSLEGLAFAFYTILYLPFRLWHSMQSRHGLNSVQSRTEL